MARAELRWRRIALYALPVAGVSFMENWISFYLLKFTSDVLQLAPGWMGAAFAVARLVDGAADPVAGYASDHTRGRFGRRRPWLAGSGLPLALVFVALWSPPASWGRDALTLWMGAAVILFYLAQSGFEVPHLALGAELVPGGGHDRTRLFAGRLALGILGTLGAALCMGLLASAVDPRVAAAQVAWLAALATLAGIALCVGSVRERRELQGRAGASPWRAFGDVLRNPHARVLLGVLFLEGMAFACLTTSMVFASEYLVGRSDLTPYLLIGAVVVIGLGIPLWLPLARRFGKRRVWLISLAVRALAFGAIFVFQSQTPAALFAGVVAIGASYGCGRMLGPAVKADVIDDDERRSSERKEGSFFASWNLASKAAAGGAVAVSGLVLQLSGFEPNAVQSESARLGILLLFAGLPALLNLAAMGLLLRLDLGREPRDTAARSEERRVGSLPSR